jgi:hypothetical protein
LRRYSCTLEVWGINNPPACTDDFYTVELMHVTPYIAWMIITLHVIRSKPTPPIPSFAQLTKTNRLSEAHPPPPEIWSSLRFLHFYLILQVEVRLSVMGNTAWPGAAATIWLLGEGKGEKSTCEQVEPRVPRGADRSSASHRARRSRPSRWGGRY